MYTAVMGAGDHNRALTTARAILDLPAAPDDLHVVVVHATDTPGTVDDAVERVTDLFGENGVETTVEAVESAPPTALVTAATEYDADLLCVGGRRHSPAGKIQLRDGAQSVILNTDRPVLVAGEPNE